MNETSKEEYVSLERIPYIYYPLCFQKNIAGIRVLIDADSIIDAMTLA